MPIHFESATGGAKGKLGHLTNKLCNFITFSFIELAPLCCDLAKKVLAKLGINDHLKTFAA